MHRPSFPFAVTGRFPEELGHHQLHLSPFGDAVAMAPVRTQHEILPPESATYARGNGFLSDRGVDIAPDEIVFKELDGLFLKGPDGPHCFVHLETEHLIDWQRHFLPSH
jgi:hypothetical protein